ncbi:MAG: hypothetical protein R3331_05325 [Sulfurospirillaceae bacterium]|nr:hypothetical protein [Sulfurospirillaceae bacterium]
MFKKLILSGAVASLVATGAMAKDYTRDIFASVGSQSSYEFGLAMETKDNLSSMFSFKKIADKDLYQGALYSTHRDNALYWGLGVGVTYSKIPTITHSQTATKPTINGTVTTKLPMFSNTKLEAYLADSNNYGASMEFNVWTGKALLDNTEFGGGDDTGIVPFLTIGVGIDKIQGKTEKSVFVKLHYLF